MKTRRSRRYESFHFEVDLYNIYTKEKSIVAFDAETIDEAERVFEVISRNIHGAVVMEGKVPGATFEPKKIRIYVNEELYDTWSFGSSKIPDFNF